MKKKENKHPDWQTTALERFSYYLGMISPYTMSGMMKSLLTTYLLLTGINPGITAIILLILKVIDGLDDILFGWIIDHFRPEKKPGLKRILGEGRFLPWYKLVCLIMPVGILGLYSMPLSLSLGFKIAWVSFFYLLTDIGYSFMDISMTSMQTTLTSNVQERDQLIMKGVVTVLLIMMPISLLANFLQSRYAGLSYTQIAYVFVGLAILLMIPMLKNVKEHAYTGKDENNHNVLEEKESFFVSMKDALKNRNLLAFFGGKLFCCIFATDEVLGIIGVYYLFGNEMVSSITGFIGTILSLIILPFMPKLYEKFDRHKIYMTLTPFAIIMSIVIFIAGPKNLVLYIILWILVSIPKSIAGGCENFIKPQVIEYGKYKTGKDCTGIQASLATFVQVLGNAFPSSIALTILAASGWISVEASSFADLVALGVTQPDSALKALWFITAGLPIVGMILMYICNLFYNTNDKDIAIMIKYNNGEITKEECDSLLSKKY